MKQVIQNDRSRATVIMEVPEPRVAPGGILVRTRASLISAGTEKTAVDFGRKSMLEKARSRPDLVKQVLGRMASDGIQPTLESVMNRLEQPIPLGYSCAGIVEEVGRGAHEFSVGQRVACAGAGYANHAEMVSVPRNLAVPIPDGVGFEDAAYVTLGAIAMQGVRVADVRLGDSVAVIGLGLLGQLSVQILRACGCRVIGIDLDPAKVELARQLGADAAVARSEDVDAAVRAFTAGVGVDAVMIAAATGSNDPVELAGEICRDRGSVTMVGAVRMDVPRQSYYMKELELRLSRSYGPGRYDPAYEEGGHDYPIAYVRWTERRNMEEFLRLVAAGHVTPGRLSSHSFPIEEAGAAYRIIGGETDEPYLGILLTYPETGEPGSPARRIELRPPALVTGAGVGFIGAGSFGKATLLPRFARSDHAELIGIATATGASARSTGEKFGFRYCSTDPARLLEDDAVNAVVITTRHGSHAGYVERALRAEKAVFVEKPLALDEEGLVRVLAAQAESGSLLTVGFNRRFSPLAAELRSAFQSPGPLAITYRVNAGPIPASHWIHDPEEGGGRIIGEVCHFLDLAQFLTDESPTEVFACSIGGREGDLHDTVSIVVRFSGGSVANINYFANGDRSVPKERIEVFGSGGVAVLDDWRRLSVTRAGKTKDWKPKRQEKGFDQEVAAFLAAVRGESGWPIPLESLVETTRATFAMEQSLREGRPIRLVAE
jgi:predicted dehydrogenase/threonine dehydrogenase-like Zn-dependent dehydrogenase